LFYLLIPINKALASLIDNENLAGVILLFRSPTNFPIEHVKRFLCKLSIRFPTPLTIAAYNFEISFIDSLRQNDCFDTAMILSIEYLRIAVMICEVQIIKKRSKPIVGVSSRTVFYIDPHIC